MAKIQVMSELLANKIAAGEVVERPASVVKELVENALDAGATEIDIELQQAGLELIRVSDNGTGIEPDDVPTAFERHATSKIRVDKDLFRISTLGFRGEALPSIAAVSRVQIKTRTDNDSAGTFLQIEAGKILDSGVTAAKKGTELTVRDLFFNTPARLKYLKSIQTELGHATEYVERMALARPDVKFRLFHNGRILVQTPGDGKLLHAVAAIYGRETVKQMVPVEWANYDYRIAGLTGYPELNRANRSHCIFIVNGRYIRSYQLSNAVQSAYHTRLPINRYPVCVLHLELDPSLVDVNVHPTKMEIRFSEEKDVIASVQAAVQSALEKEMFIPKALPSQKQNGMPISRTVEKSVQTDLKLDNSIQDYGASREVKPVFSAKPQASLFPDQIRERRADVPRPAKEAAMEAYRPESKPDIESEEKVDTAQSIQKSDSFKRIPRFRPIAQALGMYVIAENEEGLFIIDQHAAHEKILYEKFTKRLQAKELHPLPLLVPLTLELSSSEAQKLASQLSLLAEYHLKVEQFGGGAFLVRSVPDIWSGLDIQRLTSEFIDEFLGEGQVKEPRTLIEDKIITKACKSAIKANQWLSMPEMTALCEQLSELENPFTCPHGRPIIIHMTTYDLEKQFKRVM